jgi:hypothetical protein
LKWLFRSLTSREESVIFKVLINGIATNQRAIDGSCQTATHSDIPDVEVSIPTSRVDDIWVFLIELGTENLVDVPSLVPRLKERDPFECLIIVYL